MFAGTLKSAIKERKKEQKPPPQRRRVWTLSKALSALDQNIYIFGLLYYPEEHGFAEAPDTGTWGMKKMNIAWQLPL